jgi:hypothetical protein
MGKKVDAILKNSDTPINEKPKDVPKPDVSLFWILYKQSSKGF